MRKMIENLAKPNGDNMVQNKEKDEQVATLIERVALISEALNLNEESNKTTTQLCS